MANPMSISHDVKVRLFFGALALAGVFLPFWPLAVAAILLSGLMGYGIFSFMLGFLFDLLWGPPPGLWHSVIFPWMFTAVLAIVISLAARRFLLGKSLPKTLY
jgi:hypothetical protein